MLPSAQFCDTCGAANRAHARFCRVCGQLLQDANSVSAHGTLQNATLPNGTSSTLTGMLTQRHALKQRYVILGQAGRGGFGAVYKASDTQFGNRLVAVKEMSQSNLGTQEFVAATEAFRHEALLLAGLTHPNLPRIYEQFTDTGRTYLVMDFIDGETLEEHLNGLHGKKLSLEKTFEIALQLCSVLVYLHTRNPPIIFRDLKPANIMLTSGGHVYLIDFGIARHFKPGQSKDTTALGSSGYAAPEQYGKSQTTPRADIYSLGATLHQLITGDDPSETPFHFAPIQLPNQPALKGLDTLVMSMVAVDISKRPASVAEVRQELLRLSLAYRTTHPLQTGAPRAYQPPTARMPNLPPAPKRAPQARVTPQTNLLYVCMGHSSRVTSVVWSPDGKYLASASFDRTAQVWDASNGKHILTYKGHSQHVNCLAWSHDSKYLASASDDGTVQTWEALTGKTLITFRGHSQEVSAVAWSPDDFYIASGGSDKIVRVWRAKTEKLIYIYSGHTDKLHCIAWSPDGTKIASAGKDRKVHIWDPTRELAKRSLLSSILSLTRKIETLNVHNGQIFSVAWSPEGRRIASASGDRRVLVSDVQSHRQLLSMGENSTTIKNSVVWSPKGEHIAIGGNDRAVQIWNVNSQKLTFTYSGHTGYVTTVSWSPDGTKIASAGSDRTLQVWQAV
jgi:WD40 repeat protein/predicted Ser/Thr protein kinase